MTWIELDGAVNVRDLGGLPTSDGGAIVPGRLLRSENLQELSAGDVSRLVDEIGLTTVVDLRSTNEVAVEGPAPLDVGSQMRAGLGVVDDTGVLREFLPHGASKLRPLRPHGSKRVWVHFVVPSDAVRGIGYFVDRRS